MVREDILEGQRKVRKNYTTDFMPLIIVVPRAHNPSGLCQGSRPLAASNTGSQPFTDSLSNLTNLIG